LEIRGIERWERDELQPVHLANKEATKSAIDNRKDAVEAAAKDAKKQTDVDATIEKAIDNC
jgi:hypothetical protein